MGERQGSSQDGRRFGHLRADSVDPRRCSELGEESIDNLCAIRAHEEAANLSHHEIFPGEDEIIM